MRRIERGIKGVGPDQKLNRQRRIQAQPARNGEVQEINQRRTFQEKYGEDMFAYSLAFVRRDESEGYTELRSEIVGIESVVESLGYMVADWITSRPEDERGDWMVEYLQDLINLR